MSMQDMIWLGVSVLLMMFTFFAGWCKGSSERRRAYLEKTERYCVDCGAELDPEDGRYCDTCLGEYARGVKPRPGEKKA